MAAEYWTDERLTRAFPAIPWREPVRLSLAHDGQSTTLWGCRFCIAREGLKARDILNGEVTPTFSLHEVCEKHIREAHP